MAKLSTKTILGLFIDVERDLNEAYDYRAYVSRRFHSTPRDMMGSEEADYEQATLEIDELLQQRKSVIDLALANGMDPGTLLDQAAAQLEQEPEKYRVRDLKTKLRALADWQGPQKVHVQVGGHEGSESASDEART